MSKVQYNYSMLILAYQHEKYIADAVYGALSQSYKPLQIIISDDCSSDNTYNLIHDIVSKYVGPHEVILNKNEKNMGFIRHLEYCVNKYVSGDIVVLGGGDDISLPERVKLTSEIFENSNNNINYLFTNAIQIDSQGNKFGVWPEKRECGRTWHSLSNSLLLNDLSAWGCTSAIKRELLTSYDSLPSGIFQEDFLLSHRALIDGIVMHVPLVTVYYRIHNNSLWWRKRNNLFFKHYHRNQFMIYKTLNNDVQKRKIHECKLIRIIHNRLSEHYIKYRLYNNNKNLKSHVGILFIFLKLSDCVKRAFSKLFGIKSYNLFKI